MFSDESSPGFSLLDFTNTFVFSSTPNSEQVLFEVPKALTIDPFRQRRAHRKSRTGCQNCRKRRVKCDEETPCASCTRRRERCQLQMRCNSITSILSVPTQAQLLLPSSTATTVNLSHLKLFHHFQTCTQQTLLLPPEFWGESLQLCFQFEFLMNAMLSVAAQHLVILQPDDKTYPIAAASHLSRALCLFQNELSNTSTVIHLDAFIATSVLLQYGVWASTDFCSTQDNGVVSFDPGKDRIFALSSALKQVFLQSVSLVSGKLSVLLTHVAYNPRDVLVEAAQISNETLARYQAFFSYNRPLDIEHLNMPRLFAGNTDLAISTPWKNFHKIPEASDSIGMRYAHIISELCLILSFLPESKPPESVSTEKPLLPELVRYIFSFPMMCRGLFVSMFQQSDPHALFLLYHFYRAVRILCPLDQCWWAYKRAMLSETFLTEWLVRESGRVPSEPTRPV